MFQQMANKGHYRKVGGSRQGIYICSPSGALLSSVNSLDPDVVLEIIQNGLNKWNELPQMDRYLPKDFSENIEQPSAVFLGIDEQEDKINKQINNGNFFIKLF